METPGRKRKRTAIACFSCRRRCEQELYHAYDDLTLSRKKGCDGVQPTCTLCQRAGLTCEYDSGNNNTPGSSNTTREPHGGPLNDKVEALEALVRNLVNRAQGLQASITLADEIACLVDGGNHAEASSVSQTTSSSDSFQPVTSTTRRVGSNTDAGVQHASNDRSTIREDSANLKSTRPSADYLPIVIPSGHVTTTGSLLMHSRLQTLVGHFPSNLFTTTEMQRPAMPHGSAPLEDGRPVCDVDHDVAMSLCDRYDQRVSVLQPILIPGSIRPLCAKIAADGSVRLAEAAVCYAVFALAEASSSVPTAGELADDDWHPGWPYLQASLAIATRLYNSALEIYVELVQALYLCAVCYGYYARPVQAWRHLHMASTALQLYTMRFEFIVNTTSNDTRC
jgi:hypothetical protein